METTTQKSIVPQLIIAGFVSFFAFIGYMVYQAFQVDVNLVRDDYYYQSTLHNEHVADLKRTEKADIQLIYDELKNKAFLTLPASFDPKMVGGRVYFYRPSDANLDFDLPINFQDGHTMWINTSSIEKGRWNIKSEFTYNEEKYFVETSFSK